MIYGSVGIMKCKSCQKEIDAGYKMCPYCAEPIDAVNQIASDETAVNGIAAAKINTEQETENNIGLQKKKKTQNTKNNRINYRCQLHFRKKHWTMDSSNAFYHETSILQCILGSRHGLSRPRCLRRYPHAWRRRTWGSRGPQHPQR